jgi:adenine-specific DNA glycosylase
MMAELMLRRTRSDQVLEVYESFTTSYKNPLQAQQDRSGVRKELQSLGLHWRNEQLLETIDYLSDHYSKRRKLKKEDELTKIPGIGDYCNAMLRSRLFGEPVAAIDSNVARIYCRLLDAPYDPEVRRKPWIIELSQRFMDVATADEVVRTTSKQTRASSGVSGSNARKSALARKGSSPQGKSGTFGSKNSAKSKKAGHTSIGEELPGLRDPFEINLAFIDLAALVCQPIRPHCERCVLRAQCQTGKANVAKSKKKLARGARTRGKKKNSRRKTGAE